MDISFVIQLVNTVFVVVFVFIAIKLCLKLWKHLNK